MATNAIVSGQGHHHCDCLSPLRCVIRKCRLTCAINLYKHRLCVACQSHEKFILHMQFLPSTVAELKPNLFSVNLKHALIVLVLFGVIELSSSAWTVYSSWHLLYSRYCFIDSAFVAHVTVKRNRSHLNLNDAVCFFLADTSCICLLCSISRDGQEIMTPTQATPAKIMFKHRNQSTLCKCWLHCCYTC